MPLPIFEELPFYERPDLTPYLIHLTKRSRNCSAFDNLVNILREGEIRGTSTYVSGPKKAACFMDVPFISLKYMFSSDNQHRYEPYGLFLSKKFAYGKGCRPVLYLSNQETKNLKIPKDELWRVVRFEDTGEGWISWVHEREWRSEGFFELPKKISGVLVKNYQEVDKLSRILENKRDLSVTPKSILPLETICQGIL